MAVVTPPGVPAQSVPAQGLPTEFGLAEETALQKAAETQLEDARKGADSWRTGLGALIALVATIFFIKGRESVFDINTAWRWVLAACLVGAFVAAIVAAWNAMRASFGDLGPVDYDEILEEGGWYSYRASLAEIAVSRLNRAKDLTIVALVLLVSGVIITWFAPKPPASPPALVQVRDVKNTTICGELSGIEGASVVVKEFAPIPLTDLASLTVVEACP